MHRNDWSLRAFPGPAFARLLRNDESVGAEESDAGLILSTAVWKISHGGRGPLRYGVVRARMSRSRGVCEDSGNYGASEVASNETAVAATPDNV